VKEKNTVFRGLRRALRDLNGSVFAILTDTNSSVANLAPPIEQDISVNIAINTFQ
jgi:hypothetical protein